MALSEVFLALTMAFLYRSCYVRCQSEAAYQLGNLDVTSSTDNDAAVLRRQAGDSIKLVCRSSTADIEWIYPAVTSNMTQPNSPSSSLEWMEEDGEWASALTIANATHVDAGLYTCARRDRSPTPATAGKAAGTVTERLLSVFVFVSDPVSLFQSKRRAEEFTVLIGVTGRTLLLPCGVTSPDTRVKLYQATGADGRRTLLANWTGDAAEGGSGEALAVAAESPRVLRYEPRFGFTMEVASLQASGSYYCRAERGNATQEKRLILRVISGSLSAIGQPWMSSKTGFAHTQGSTIDLRCTTLVLKGNPVTMKWTKDRTTISNLADRRVTIEPPTLDRPCSNESVNCTLMRSTEPKGTPSAYNRVTSRLRIRNAVPCDRGTYECSASTAGISKSTTCEVSIRTIDVDQDPIEYAGDDEPAVAK